MVSARNKNPVNQLRRLNKEQEVDLEKGPILAALEQAREEQSEEKWGEGEDRRRGGWHSPKTGSISVNGKGSITSRGRSFRHKWLFPQLPCDAKYARRHETLSENEISTESEL